jgi:hypothetical protein
MRRSFNALGAGDAACGRLLRFRPELPLQCFNTLDADDTARGPTSPAPTSALTKRFIRGRTNPASPRPREFSTGHAAPASSYKAL